MSIKENPKLNLVMETNLFKVKSDIYRIIAVMKVETEIITGITVSPKGRAVIIVKMYVDIFKTDIIGFFLSVMS